MKMSRTQTATRSGPNLSPLIACLLLLFLHQPHLVLAATPPNTTLDSLVQESLQNHPELKFYQAELDAARSARKLASQLSNPELSATAGNKSVSSPTSSSDGTAWSVSLMQPFDWPGRISLRKAIANQDIELAQLGLDRFKTALAGRVRSAAYQLFAAQQRHAAAAEVAQRFQALREVLVQRDPAGLTPILETRVIEATELNAHRKATDASLAVQHALLELNQLRGAAPQDTITLAPPTLSFPPPPDPMELIAMAHTNHFDLRTRTTELTQQGFKVNLARKDRYPGFTIGPTFSEEKVGNDRERILGIGVSLPLPLWKGNKVSIEIAEARRKQAEVLLLLAEREVDQKVAAAALTYRAKHQEMNLWHPDSVDHFKQAADLADRHYRLGAVPIAVYVELQKQYLDAVEGLLQTRQEALEAAHQLELLTGKNLISPATSTPESKP